MCSAVEILYIHDRSKGQRFDGFTTLALIQAIENSADLKVEFAGRKRTMNNAWYTHNQDYPGTNERGKKVRVKQGMEVQTIKGEYIWLPTKAPQSVHGDVNTNGFGHFPKMLDGKPGVAMYVIHPDAVRVVPIDTQKAENDACISTTVGGKELYPKEVETAYEGACEVFVQHRRDTFDARSKQHGAFPLKEGEKETFADGMADKGFALSVAQAVVDRLVERGGLHVHFNHL